MNHAMLPQWFERYRATPARRSARVAGAARRIAIACAAFAYATTSPILLARAGPPLAGAGATPQLALRGIAGPEFSYLGEMRAPYLAHLRDRGIDTVALGLHATATPAAAKEESLVVADVLRGAAADGVRVALELRMACTPPGTSVAPAAFVAGDRALTDLIRLVRTRAAERPAILWTLGCASEDTGPASDPADAARAEAILRAMGSGPRPLGGERLAVAGFHVLVVPSVDRADLTTVARRIPDAEAIGMPVHVTGDRPASAVDCRANRACAQHVFAAARADGTWTRPWIVSGLSAPSDADAATERIGGSVLPRLSSTDRIAADLARTLRVLRAGPGAPDGIIVDGWLPPERFDFVRADRYFTNGVSDRGVDRTHVMPTAAVRTVAAAFGRSLPAPRPDPSAVSARGIRMRVVTGGQAGRRVLAGSTVEFSTGARTGIGLTQDWFVSPLGPSGVELLGVPTLAGHGPTVLYHPSTGAGAFRVWTVVRGGGEASATSLTYVVCATFPC